MQGPILAENGVSIMAYTPYIDPTAGTYNPRGQIFEKNFMQRVSSYSHEKDNTWGYKSISVSIAGNHIFLDNWYEKGIGKHIEVYNSAGEVIMAGFVNRITITSGTMKASRGPLVDICNRCSVVYTPIIDLTVSPPITGAEKSTILADNAASQRKYGIIEKVLSGGQLIDDGTTDEAVDYRDRYLDERREPDTGDKGITLGDSKNNSVELEILGYYAWLDLYIYASIATGTTTVSAKMETVLGADPNGVISSSYTEIETNNLLTPNYDNDNRTAKTIIEEMVKRGNDTDDKRRIFGIFAFEKARYETIPDEFTYYYKIGSRNQNIRTYSGGESGAIMRPWDVKAGKWLFVGDFVPGRFTDTDNKKDDPRAIFIENVNFTLPFGLSINGIGVSELPQYLAKLGVK